MLCASGGPERERKRLGTNGPSTFVKRQIKMLIVVAGLTALKGTTGPVHRNGLNKRYSNFSLELWSSYFNLFFN